MGTITVRVGTMPGEVRNFALNAGATVADALSAASLTSAGYEIRVRGAVVDTTKVLAEGDLVLLVKQIKGN